jgi:hypothetical protein
VRRILASLSALVTACGAASAPAVEPALRARIDDVEVQARAVLVARLRSIELYRGEMHVEDNVGDLAASHPDMHYEDRTLDGAVLGTSGLSDHRTERTITIWGTSTYAQLGWEGDHHLATIFPFGSAGGLDARCDDCVHDDGTTIEVHGTFRAAYGDGSARLVAMEGSLTRITLADATSEELARFFRAIEETAWLVGYRSDAHPAPRLDGNVLVLESGGSVETEIDGPSTHGCVELFAYGVERRFDLHALERSTSRVVSVGGRFERCCPRDETGAPCSPGPTCELRPLP